MDATEKGQLSYHAGTAAGLTLAEMALAPGPGAVYWAVHLTRYQAGGGNFNFAGPMRPDLVLLSMQPPLAPPYVVNHIVIWECKGHATNQGQAPLGPALQTIRRAVINVTTMPGAPFPVFFPAPIVPAAYVASQVDVFPAVAGNYRLQATDPSGPPPIGTEFGEEPMNNFFRFDHAPFAQILRANTQRQQRNYDGTLFETLEVMPKIRFGMEASLYRAFVAQSATFTSDVGRAIAAGFPNMAPDSVFVDPTGLSLELEAGWASR